MVFVKKNKQARIHSRHHKRVYEEHFEREKMCVRVARFQPEKQPAGFLQDFELMIHSGQTVLDCLQEIKWKKDATLSFKRNCSNGVCGTCGIKVSGKAWLACKVQALQAAREGNGTMIIEPLSGVLVQRDLVVDEKPFWSQVGSVMPWIVARADEQKRNHKMNRRNWKSFKKSHECVMCMVCDSNAQTPYVPGHLGPGALVKAFRYEVDARDGAKKERLERMVSMGLFNPELDLEAANPCPRDILPGQKIRMLRRWARRKGIKKG